MTELEVFHKIAIEEALCSRRCTRFSFKKGSPMLAVVPQPCSNSRPPTLAAIGFLGWWMSCDAQWLAQRRSHKAFRTHCNRSDGLVQRQFAAELRERHRLWDQPRKLKLLYRLTRGNLGTAIALGKATGQFSHQGRCRAQSQAADRLGCWRLRARQLSQGTVEEVDAGHRGRGRLH